MNILPTTLQQHVLINDISRVRKYFWNIDIMFAQFEMIVYKLYFFNYSDCLRLLFSNAGIKRVSR